MIKIFPRLAALLLMGALALPFGAKADVATTPQPFSTTAASGTIGPWTCANGTTATITFTSGGGSTITIKTAADSAFSAAYAVDTTFGTAGVITAPAANTQVPGDMINASNFVEGTFTGNTGTLAGTFSCTGAASGYTDLNGNLITKGILVGSGGAIYQPTQIDTPFTSALFNSATTTTIVTGVAGSYTFIGDLGYMAMGGETAALVNVVWGTGANCSTVVGTLFPSPMPGGAAAGGTTSLWSGSINTGAVVQNVAPAPWYKVIPIGDNVCGTTAGTTINGKFFGDTAQHP